MTLNEVYSIWVNGNKRSLALGVILVGETDAAFKFKILNSDRDLTFFLPKKAIKLDATNEGIMLLARWFKVEGFLANMFDRFANSYSR